MFVIVKWCLFTIVVNVCVNTCVCEDVEAVRPEFGYSRGVMSVCPGSTKPARIPKSQMKHLFFIVQGKGRSRQKYTYWNAKNIAKDKRIDFKRRTMVVAIGYLDSSYFAISTTFANMYEDRGYNVILVDNQRFATVHYYMASRLMRPVGKHVAEVLAQLTESGLNPSKLELIGFSLGGHTISFIGKNYQRLTGRNVSKIIALEPSGPCFRFLPPEERLTASDADFVQVLHTNIDGFGMAARMGHVDFYINGGEFQPSEITFYPCTVTCSHFRVLALWQSALQNPNKFIAMQCDSIQQARDFACYDRPLVTNVMGANADPSKPGIFYLSTSKEYPYYLGEKGLQRNYASWIQLANNINDGNETEIYT